MNIEEIDKYCDLFEEQLKSNRALTIEDFLKSQQLQDHPQLVEELNRVASELRQTQSQPSGLKSTADVKGRGAGLNETIGSYKLLQQIGEGGMGTVYLAQQQKPVARRVALKVIKAGMGSKEIIARFESERQALAMMDHENIAKMFDAGTTEDGRPYFVMELVRGVPLTKFCDDNKLTIKERLNLFATVCQAVQHAHQKGIIHRDIKPSNVLVSNYDGRAVPKVIDFGVAKAMQQRLTDKTLFTEFGRVIGTLQYMSPEQAGLSHLDIDTRSDIYSLGVLLYELLTGSTPIDKQRIREAGWERVMQMIRDEEPRKPSTKISESGDALPDISTRRSANAGSLGSMVRGDLDWIVMKALEKDRSRRYETASGMARDIERHLLGDMVEARPPSWGYRTSRFVRKNRVALGVMATFVVTLLVFASIAAWLAVRAMDAEDDAMISLAAERKAKQEASDALASAKKRLVQIENGTRLLSRIFDEINPTTGKSGSELREALGQKIRTLSAELDAQDIADPLVVADLQSTLGGALRNLGYWAELIEVLEKAEKTYGESDNADEIRFVSTKFSLALSHLLNGDTETAIPMMEQVLERIEQTPNWGGSEIADAKTIPFILSTMAAAYHESRKYNEAEKLIDQLRNSFPTTELADIESLAVLNQLAVSLNFQGKWQDSIPVLELCKKFLEDHPENWSRKSIPILNNLAVAYGGAGRFADAIETHKFALEIAESELTPENRLYISLFHNLAAHYKKVGEIDKSLEYGEKALSWMKENYSPDHPATLTAIHNLADTYRLLGRYDQALNYAQQAYSKRKAKFGEENMYTVLSLNTLAVCYSSKGEVEQAIELLEGCLEANRDGQLKDSHYFSLTMHNLAMDYSKAGKTEQSLALMKSACEKQMESLGRHPSTALSFLNLGGVCLENKRWEDAKEAYEECLNIYKDHPSHQWLMHYAQSGMALALAGLGKFDEAEAELNKSYAITKIRDSIPVANQKSFLIVLERHSRVYAMWHEADPEKGFDQKAEEWKAMWDAEVEKAKNRPANSQD